MHIVGLIEWVLRQGTEFEGGLQRVRLKEQLRRTSPKVKSVVTIYESTDIRDNDFH